MGYLFYKMNGYLSSNKNSDSEVGLSIFAVPSKPFAGLTQSLYPWA